MVQSPTRTIGFFCPVCRQPVIVERSPFQLTAGNSNIDCPCGGVGLQVEIMGEKVRVTVPCLFCDDTHVVTCTTHAFLHERIIAFSCHMSGLDSCYIGEEDRVFIAMKRLEETVDVLEREALAEGGFLNPAIMEEILAELRDLGAAGHIGCSCGNSSWKLAVNYSSVELSCGSCGGGLKIPAATLTDVDDLCCKHKLLIRGRTEVVVDS